VGVVNFGGERVYHADEFWVEFEVKKFLDESVVPDPVECSLEVQEGGKRALSQISTLDGVRV
jgi:hypothetical protein